MEYLNEEYVETRGRKALYTNEPLDENIETFIAWVEGRYIPRDIEEEERFIAWGERCYPHLMHNIY